MALSRDAFVDAFTALGQLLPMGKTLGPQAIALAWGLFPLTAKELLDPEHLLFAMQQLQADPDPARELSVPLQLLRYLFPLEHGRPVYERGLRPDLAERMARPDRFHPLNAQAAERPAAEVIAEQGLGPSSGAAGQSGSAGSTRLQLVGGLALLGGAGAQVQLEIRPLLLAAHAVVDAAPGPDCPFTPAQLQTGALLAAGSLVGRWRLEQIRPADGRPCLAAAWIDRHPKGWEAMQVAASVRLENRSRSQVTEFLAEGEPAAAPGHSAASGAALTSLAA